MHPKQLHIGNYTYQLPDEKIAHYPLPERDSSKLLVYKQGQLTETLYRHIANHLPPNALLVFNNTRVIHARLFFENANGGKIEVFCLEPHGHALEMATAMSKIKTVQWKCMIGRAAKWKEKVLRKQADNFELTAEMVDRTPDGFVVEFNWQPQHLTFAEILDKAGMMPIPPYLKRHADEVDESRYQTVFAKHEGSVAAPTAGLHFTPEVLQSIQEKGIATTEVTLHVGAGTFMPVKSETMHGHNMHAEWMDVKPEALQNILKAIEQQQPVVAVGTTAMRTLESLYWMGIKAAANPRASVDELEVKQWDAYELQSPLSVADALKALVPYAKRTGSIVAKTQILIAPPYTPKVVNVLATNFHQPNSTLLLLVAAVVGNNWKKIYDYALAHNFRFLSYGDGSLLYVEK